MNKREEQTVLPFIGGGSASAGNCHTDGTRYVLHETTIAIVLERDHQGRPSMVAFNAGGWHTHTTRSRINAILSTLTQDVVARVRDGVLELALKKRAIQSSWQTQSLENPAVVRIRPDMSAFVFSESASREILKSYKEGAAC